MPLLEVNWNPSEKELRQFAVIWLPLACVALGFLIWRWTSVWNWALIPVVIAAILSPAACWIPGFAQRLYVGWMTAVLPIGWVVSHLLMGTIYFLLITPMGLIMRLCGRNAMGRRFDESKDSYWVPHEPPKNDQQYFRQY